MAHRQMSLQGAQRSVMQLDAYSRHKKFVNDYVIHYGATRPEGWRPPVKVVTDSEILRENHRFIRTEDDDGVLTWEKKLAKKYYDKLFKEYAIADLSRYKEGAEVVTGKGQFSCGAKRCEEFNDLQSFEVDFNYREVGEKKQALVKLRVCPECGRRLNYRHQRKKAKRRRAQEKEEEEKDEEERSREEQAAKRQRGSGAARGGGGGGETRALERCVDEPSPKAKAAAVSKQHGKSSAAAASPKDRGRANRKGSTPGGGAAAAAAPAPAERAAASSGGGGGSVWSVPVVAEKTIHDEFDDYFNDLMQ